MPNGQTPRQRHSLSNQAAEIMLVTTPVDTQSILEALSYSSISKTRYNFVSLNLHNIFPKLIYI